MKDKVVSVYEIFLKNLKVFKPKETKSAQPCKDKEHNQIVPGKAPKRFFNFDEYRY